MRIRSITAFLSLIAAATSLPACGGQDRVDTADLPNRLAEALPRLEEAGFEVDAVALGRDETPALVVTQGDAAVVLATGDGIGRTVGAIPPMVRDVSGHSFDASLQTICGPNEYVATTRGVGPMASRVIRLGRFC